VWFYGMSGDFRTAFQTQRAFRSPIVISAQAASVGRSTAVRIGGPPRIAEAKIAPAQSTAFETISMRFMIAHASLVGNLGESSRKPLRAALSASAIVSQPHRINAFLRGTAAP
jgi:hypothetical protein